MHSSGLSFQWECLLADFLSNWSIAWFITSWNSFMNSIQSAFQFTSDKISSSSVSSWSLSWSGGDSFVTSHCHTFPVWLLDSPVTSHLSVDRHCRTCSCVFGGISSTALSSVTVSVTSQTFCVSVSGQPSSAVEVTQSHGLTEGKTRVWIINLNTIKGISPDRGENQREKSKVSPLPVSPYYTTLSCTQTHYSVRTDPPLRGPLTDSGCTYASYFTSAVTPEVKAERSSEMGAERSFDLKSGAGQSSDLGVGWNLEQQKCEMGCPLTIVDFQSSGCIGLEGWGWLPHYHLWK